MTRRALGSAAALGLVLAAPAHAVLVPTAKWGSQGAGDGQFSTPVDVAADASGAVYVADRDNDRIQKFTRDGAFLLRFGSSGSGPGRFRGPAGVATDSQGAVYVVDAGNARVQKFTSEGSFVTQWGSAGGLDGQFNLPAGIATDPVGDVYVVDSGNNRVQKFNSDGAFLIRWGAAGPGGGQFNAPAGIGTDARGDVYVADRGNERVQKFSSAGTFLLAWGARGGGAGQFLGAYDVAPDAAGTVHASESEGGRIQQFNPEGAFLGSAGSPGAGDGQLSGPTGLTAAVDGSLFAADSGNHRVQRFADDQAVTLSPPVAGRTVNLEPVSGEVRVRERGARRFERLLVPAQVRVGSVVDTTKGRVRLTSARSRTGVQAGEFFDGRFRVLQGRGRRPVTELRMEGGSFAACRLGKGATAAQRRRSRRVRRLWGDGRGRFRTRGRFSSAVVRGTVWLTEDRCDGTLVRVRDGRVRVRDLARRRNIDLRAGERYLARAPR